MKRPGSAALLLALLVGLIGATAAAAGDGDMTVTASSHARAAKGVRLTAVLQYEIQCGYPGPLPVVLTLPGHVAAKVAASAVLVDGKVATGVTVKGHTLTIAMPPRPHIMCDSITLGKLTLTLTGAAGLTNPAASGHYTVTAVKGSAKFSTTYTVD